MIIEMIVRLLSFAYFIMALNSCGLRSDPACEFDGSYEFLLKAELRPQQDTFTIGDTLYFKSYFSNSVFERKTQKEYLLVDFSFFPQSSLRKIDENPADIDANKFMIVVDSSFNYEITSSSLGNNKISGGYTYTSDGFYLLEFAVVCQTPGLFYFTHNSFLGPLVGQDQEFPGKCKGKALNTYTDLNGGADNNLYLLENSADPLYYETFLSNPQKYFYDHGGFAFYVKE